MYYSHQTPILIESQWNLNKITNLSTGEFIRILIESQWNLNNTINHMSMVNAAY